MAINWRKIKNEYISTTISQRALADKYGISSRSVTAKSTAEGWVELRKKNFDEASAKLQQKTTEKIIEREATELAEMASALDAVYSVVMREVESLKAGKERNTKQKKIKDYSEKNKPKEMIERTDVESTLDKAQKIVNIINKIVETRRVISPEDNIEIEDAESYFEEAGL